MPKPWPHWNYLPQDGFPEPEIVNGFKCSVPVVVLRESKGLGRRLTPCYYAEHCSDFVGDTWDMWFCTDEGLSLPDVVAWMAMPPLPETP